MTTDIPKPIFVIGDVLSASYTTAIDVANLDGKDEPMLICGTNDGSINIWSLSTYRCLHRIEPNIVANLTSKLSPKDIFRVNSIVALPSSISPHIRFVCQLKTSAICLFELQGLLSFKRVGYWDSFETTFSKCFRILDNCVAFLKATSSDDIQLINTDRAVTICELKLIRYKELDQKSNHGLVMSIYLFCKDIIPLSECPTNEKQAFYVLAAYEDGFISLHRASLEDNLETINEQTLKDSGRMKEAVQMSALQMHPELVTCMDFHEATMRGMSCSVDNEIALWDVNVPETVLDNNADNYKNSVTLPTQILQNKLGLQKSKQVKLTNAGILCCAIRPDGRIFAIGGKDGRVRLFGFKSGKPLAILPYHPNTIECVRFSHNLAQSTDRKKYLLFASSRDKSISIWSLYNDEWYNCCTFNLLI